MKNSITYLLVFLAIQFAGGSIIQALWKLATGSVDVTPLLLITSTAAISLLSIGIFLWAHWVELSPNWLRSRPWMTIFWTVITGLGLIVPSMWLQEQMPELPNIAEQQFDMILANRWGYLTIGILAPLAEEVVFRGAILKSLLATRLSPLTAVLFSAVFFALVHVNPAQMPHAFLAGLLLGWMYYRTGSILPGMCLHWVNNSVAYAMYNLIPNPDVKLIELFKGSQTNVYMALGFSLLILLPALYQLHVWMRRAE
jgi:membrane protease YdiL (CAAX protease family)